MKYLWIPVLMLSSCLAQAADDESWPETARAASGELAVTLQQALKTALASGGISEGIQACNLQALPLTEAISHNQGVKLSRVSEQNRNPANAPNDWQLEVLKSFSKRLVNGEDGSGLEWSQEAQVNGGTEFRYMKAIPTQAVCLQCHGEILAPEVASVISHLYPKDRATGFRVGDLRGAFVAVRPDQATKIKADQN